MVRHIIISQIKGILKKNPNGMSITEIAGAIACLLLVLYVPLLQNLFRFGTISPVDLLSCILAGGLSVFWFEGYTVLVRDKETAVLPSGGNIDGY
jgi:hypothetical protein